MQKEGNEEEIFEYCLESSGNVFFRKSGPPPQKISFPAGTTVKRTSSGFSRIFTMSNKNMEFRFSLLSLGSGGVSHSIIGDLIDKHVTDPGSWYTNNYILTLDVTFKKGRRWSPRTTKHRLWMEQLFEMFERDFNLEVFKEELEDGLRCLSEETRLHELPLRFSPEKGKDDVQS